MPSLETIMAAAVKSGTFIGVFGAMINDTSPIVSPATNSNRTATGTFNRAANSNSAIVSMESSERHCGNCGLPKLVVASLLIFIIVNLLSGAIVGLRLTTRRHRLKTLCIEDYLISIAWLLGLIAGVVSHYRDLRGFGAPLPSPAELSAIYRQQFVFMQLFYLTLATIQASVALNYKSFSGGLNTWHIRLSNAALLYIMLGSLLESSSYFFQCLPVSAFWEFEKRLFAKCYSTLLIDIFLIYGPPIFRIIGDLSLILIPLPIIFSLSLPRSQKFAVVGVICITFLSIASNLQRLRLTTPTASSSIPNFLGSILPQIQIWSNIEIGSAIICACAVTLKAPVTEFWNSLFSQPASKQTQQTGSGEIAINEKVRKDSNVTWKTSVVNTTDSIEPNNMNGRRRKISDEEERVDMLYVLRQTGDQNRDE